MIKLNDLYALIEANFDFLIVTNEREEVIHASQLLTRSGGREHDLVGRPLAELLAPDSHKSFRLGMTLAREQVASPVIYTPHDKPSQSIPLRTGSAETDDGRIFLFFGAAVDSLSRLADADKDERVKELSCIYTVAEWIESSRSIKEFFQRLPDYLHRGMRYPESTVVQSIYLGEEYGQSLEGKAHLTTKLVINHQVAGEIRVGYLDQNLSLLPEEQRMLDEIGHMLNLALERKQLSENLALKKEEELAFKERLATLEKEIAARTMEFEDQCAKLDKINTYVERVNRGWEESKTWLEVMLKGMTDPIALIDRKRTVVMTNKESVQPGDHCYKTFFHRDEPCEDCRLARIIRDKTPITLTVAHNDRFIEVHALPIFNRNHEVDGIMEFFHDITLERTYEQQLRQADQLASLGQLVSGIGHEINNPNQFIRGNIKILKQALDDMLPIVDAHQREHPDLKIARLPYAFFREHIMTLVNDMAHGSERIKGIVESLKRFARRDDGLLIDRVDINTLIEACLRLVHNEVHKRADLELDLEPRIPSFVGNSQKIEQVLVNLIVNAAQAMSDDVRGLIKVTTRSVAGHVVISVADNGKGMTQKTQKQIFDPFFTTKRAKGGTGLGLAIAYRIIEEHGGSIAVQSELGEGTTFTIRLPHKEQEAKPAAVAEIRENV